MGMINTAMTDWLNAMGGTSKVLLGAIVAGMMSIDMGGLFNKAAYVFGIAALASGNYEVMAAVMVGGMVPPIAIALSTTCLLYTSRRCTAPGCSDAERPGWAG